MYPTMGTLPLDGDQEKVTSLSPTEALKLTGVPKTSVNIQERNKYVYKFMMSLSKL